MRKLMVAALSVSLAAPGCVASQGPRLQTAPVVQASSADRQVLGEFAGLLDLGTRVKVTVTGNKTIRGTLVRRTPDALVLQPRARVPEPLVEVKTADLLAIEPETRANGGTSKAIAIGVAVGVGAAVGTLFILAAILSD
jgi:hypothetical protein